jgi:hypothetical protein
MNSCPIPAIRSPGQPFPCWPGPEPARLARAQREVMRRELVQPPLEISRQPPIPGLMLPQPIPSRRVQEPQLLVPDEICLDLRGCGDGGTHRVVSIQLQRTLPLVPPPAQGPPPVLFLVLFLSVVSTGGATRLLAPRVELVLKFGLELPRARPVHHHRTSAARVRAPWLLPWWTRLRAFCGASSARSSIYAYSCL